MILLRLPGQNLLALLLLRLSLLVLGVGVARVTVTKVVQRLGVGAVEVVLLFGVFIMLMICLRL